MDHIILTGCQKLKLALNFEFLFTFLFSTALKKKEQNALQIMQPFLNPEGAPKGFSQEH